MNRLKILIVDDDMDALQALKMGIEDENHSLLTSSGYKETLQIIKEDELDIIVTDLKLKNGSGLDILTYVVEHHPGTAVIIITAYGSVESAVECIRRGAYDYLAKPFRLADLKRLINRIGETIHLRKENERLRQRLQGEPSTVPLVGVSKKFRQVIEIVKQIANSKSTVLITGETGTGKEVIACTIHSYSSRSHNPFVKINCGAIPENLMEAEIFGYERGAFTGAVKQKKGKIELANGGTLFLDEIGELNTQMQVKLLHFLQDGEFEHLGSTEKLRVDVRIIAASNADLEDRVTQNTFREDLFYRLNVISLHLPPLRDRREDIPYLVQYFIEKYNQINNKNIEGLDPKVMKELIRYSWKGNVRELENMVERAVVLSQEKLLRLYHFPGLTTHVDGCDRNLMVEIGMSLADIEKQVIEKSLQYHNYDKQKTAQMLQIGLATLYRKIKEYKLEA